MGYFTKQLYNEPMPMYVDPRLDILANSVNLMQQRHDKLRAESDMFDIMASNEKVVEGDQAIRDAAIARLKQEKDAMASRGDYANAAGKLGMIAKDYATNETLNEAKSNYTAIQDYMKQRQALGSSALDFNPADGFTTVDPTTGKSRRFVADLEKMKDWDTRKLSIMKLMPDTKDLGLDHQSIQGYISQGSATGINAQKVKDYVDEGLNRYLSTEEGKQEFKALTRGANGATPMSEADAKRTLASSLFDVGKQQVFSKVDKQYGVDQWDMFNAEQNARLKVIEAEAEAKAKTKGPGSSEYVPNAYLQLINEQNTAVTPEALKGILPEGSQPGTFSIPLQNQIVNYAQSPKLTTPENRDFMDIYEKYRNAFGDADIDAASRKDKVREWKIQAEADRRAAESGQNVFYDHSSRKYVTTGVKTNVTERRQRYEETQARLENIEAVEKLAKERKIDLNSKDVAERYKILRGDATGKLGDLINMGGYADFRVNTSANNKRNVGNNMYIEGEVILNADDLGKRMQQLGYGNEDDWTGSPFTDEWQEIYLEGSGGNGMIKPAGTDKDGRQLYSIPIKQRMEVSKNLMQTFNKNNMGTDAYTKNAAIHDKEFDIVKINPYVQRRVNTIKDPKLKAAVMDVYSQAIQNYNVDALEYLRTATEQQLKDELL